MLIESFVAKGLISVGLLLSRIYIGVNFLSHMGKKTTLSCHYGTLLSLFFPRDLLLPFMISFTYIIFQIRSHRLSPLNDLSCVSAHNSRLLNHFSLLIFLLKVSRFAHSVKRLNLFPRSPLNNTTSTSLTDTLSHILRLINIVVKSICILVLFSYFVLLIYFLLI